MTDVTPILKAKKKRRKVATSPSLAKEKATNLHSLIVRSTSVCVRCGYECPCADRWPTHHSQAVCKLQCAHIISRTYGHTRTDERNAFAACISCHEWWGKNPVEFTSFVLEKLGRRLYDELYEKSQQKSKVNWQAELERLTRLWVAIGGTP